MSETKIILDACCGSRMFGHTTGRHGKTMWMCFMKIPKEIQS